MEKVYTELENQNLIVCAWRLDIKISAEEYVDALDRLILLAKKEVFDDIEEMFGGAWMKEELKEFKKLNKKHLWVKN